MHACVSSGFPKQAALAIALITFPLSAAAADWIGTSHGVYIVQANLDWSGERIQLSWAPRAYLLKRFLTDAECDHLIELSEPYMRNSTVANSRTGQSMASEVRTSTGSFLAKGRDEIVSAVEKRVAQVWPHTGCDLTRCHAGLTPTRPLLGRRSKRV